MLYCTQLTLHKQIDRSMSGKSCTQQLNSVHSCLENRRSDRCYHILFSFLLLDLVSALSRLCLPLCVDLADCKTNPTLSVHALVSKDGEDRNRAPTYENLL